ncbi:MAG TPA: hypothetical protein VII26_05330 [Candidatus Limnocylindria bacterium]
MLRSMDTSLEAAEVQAATFRRMSPSERLALAFEMSEEVRQLALSGLRVRHPGWDEERLHDALLEVMLGPDLAARVIRSR